MRNFGVGMGPLPGVAKELSEEVVKNDCLVFDHLPAIAIVVLIS